MTAVALVQRILAEADLRFALSCCLTWVALSGIRPLMSSHTVLPMNGSHSSTAPAASVPPPGRDLGYSTDVFLFRGALGAPDPCD
jgi:hypothetical protein